MREALKTHWPEYLMEAAGLGIFMVSASVFTILLYHPGSPALQFVPEEFPRRVLMGLAMGLTAIGIIYSPWGKQSGAHLNPAVTLTFFRLGKVASWDAVLYVIAQFAGGVAGVSLVAAAAGKLLAHPSVNYVATLPGSGGTGAAFLGEFVIAFILMSVVLVVSNTQNLARFTGMLAGACVAAFITFEAPISGMSMNPARTFGSAILPLLWDALWIYFLAPPLGMLAAAAGYLRLKLVVTCAKLHHQNKRRCIFCEYQAARQKEIPLDKSTEMSLPLSEKTTPAMRVLFLCLPAMFVATVNAQNTPLTFQSSEKQTALIELYTSEGCSSCPPAETWLSRLRTSPGLWKDFVPLAFHVDYWDHLGWRDPWASKSFSDRQRAYAKQWRSASIYTPGFVLNGKEWRDWSGRKDGPKSGVAKAGVLTVSSADMNRWHVSFAPANTAGADYEVHAALLAGGLSSNVKAGENRGHLLRHDFVVLTFARASLVRSGDVAQGEFVFNKQRSVAKSDLALAVWITAAGRLEPLQATGGWLARP